VKGNLHWVSGPAPPSVEVRLYDHLFTTEDPASSANWEAELNPGSERILLGARIDASLAASVQPGARFQFERLGYFVLDKDSRGADSLVFNEVVSLKDNSKAKASAPSAGGRAK